MSDPTDPLGDAPDGPGLPGMEGADDQATPYQVLARKYRPRDFSQLIGQEALVRTLSNAIQTRRLAHAFILTGVRGVGKTTTARIIAKALNYVGPEGTGEPTAGPTDDCPICQAITEDRHPDVIELDAASRTGVDDIREIIESVRYGPVEARFKIFIIDEVHMLSRNAFNALLKTLEEPPEHVKFIFATTEIRKVPVTVLSRCQRFDLRRVEQPVLAAHFARIVEMERGTAEEEAIAMIARAADGSVRDGLSLLDQGLVLGDGRVEAEAVQRMLGLADRSALIGLFEALVGGEPPVLLERLDQMHAYGADPVVVLQDLLDFSHFLTRLKLLPTLREDVSIPEMERAAGGALIGDLGMAILARLWQMLMKGLSEVQQAPNPQSALEMVLLRVMHGAHLPSPADLMSKLDQSGGGSDAPVRPGGGTPAGGRAGSGGDSGGPRGGDGSSANLAPGDGGQGGGIRMVSQAGGTVAPPTLSMASAQAPTTSPALRLAVDNTAPPSPSAALADTGSMLDSFEAVVALFEAKEEHRLAATLKTAVHLVAFAPGRITLNLQDTVPPTFSQTVASRLSQWAGQRWIVVESDEAGARSLIQQERDATAAEKEAARSLPLVAAALEAFPGSEIVEVRKVPREPVDGTGLVRIGSEMSTLDDDGYAHDDVVGEEDDADPFLP